MKEPYLDKYKVGLNKEKLTGDFTLKGISHGVNDVVPKDHIFVLGDNRKDSYDSRYFGFVPIENVVGKVNLRYWPIGEINTDF